MKTGSIKQLRQRDPGRRAFASWAACGLLLSAAIPAQVQAEDAQAALSPSGEYSVYETEAAQTPPMGWNPWNAFRTDVDEEKIRGSAEALVNNGLAQLGYRYVNRYRRNANVLRALVYLNREPVVGDRLSLHSIAASEYLLERSLRHVPLFRKSRRSLLRLS